MHLAAELENTSSGSQNDAEAADSRELPSTDFFRSLGIDVEVRVAALKPVAAMIPVKP